MLILAGCCTLRLGNATILFTFTYDPEVSFKANPPDDTNLREWIRAASEEELENMLHVVKEMARQDPFDAGVTSCDRQLIGEMSAHMDDVKERLRLLRLRKSNRAAGGSSSKF